MTKLNASGALVYSTYLGGSGNDGGNGIAVDSSGERLRHGQHRQHGLPRNARSGSPAAARRCLRDEAERERAALVYSTYLGGTGYDLGQGIAVDGNGNAYVTGYTSSTNFPTRNAFQPTYGAAAMPSSRS